MSIPLWPKDKEQAIEILNRAAANLDKAAEEYDDLILHTEALNLQDIVKFLMRR